MKEKETTLMLLPKGEVQQKKSTPRRMDTGAWLARLAGFFLARAVPVAGLAPFGIAFLAMERKGTKESLISFLAVVLGYLSRPGDRMLAYIAACVVYEGALLLFQRQEGTSLKGSLWLAVTVTAFFDIGSMFFTGMDGGSILCLLADGTLVALGILVFDRCHDLMEGSKFFGRPFSGEEKLSLCVMGAIALLSFQGLPLPFSVANMLGMTILGTAAVSGGLLAATVAGFATGVVLGLNGDLLNLVAVFGGCGFACGALRRFGKWGVAGAQVAVGVLLSVYAAESGSDAIRFYEVIVGAVALVLLPGKVFRAGEKLTDFDFAKSVESRICREQVQDKLNLAAESFQTLAETFARISDKENMVEMQDIAMMFDTAAERVCRNCSKVRDCWQKNFHTTYKTMLRFLEILEHKGVLELSDTGAYFSQSCLRQEALVKEINRLFEVYKINRVWKSKLCENRDLVRQQFDGVAEIFRQISGEVAEGAAFDTLAAEEIACRLQTKGVTVEKVRVTALPHMGKSVQLSLGLPVDEGICRSIPAILKGVLGVTFFRADTREEADSATLHLHFYEAPQMQVAAGFATGCKQEESGDSYSLHHLRGGKFLAALSDGMGCGHRAGRESGSIVTLIERFMEAGFDKTVAVRLINSVMVMKSANEAFATVDTCMIDLNTGEAEFIKNGAEASYIKRGGRIETVRGTSLPVGVVARVEMETFVHKLGRGDVVVMVSDGLEMKQGHEGWLRHTLEHLPASLPVQELADRIMEKALALKGGTPDDDMTVMVLRLE